MLALVLQQEGGREHGIFSRFDYPLRVGTVGGYTEHTWPAALVKTSAASAHSCGNDSNYFIYP